MENSHQRRQTTTLVIRSPTFAAGWWWWWWWCAPSSRSWSWSPSGRRVKAALLWTVALPFVAGRAGLAPPPPGRPPFRSSTFYPAERDREMADDESSGTRRPFLADRLFSPPLSLSLHLDIWSRLRCGVRARRVGVSCSLFLGEKKEARVSSAGECAG